MAEKRHPGITMHKLTFGSGFVGLLFTVGCSLIFVLGFPMLWYFVAFSAALGVAVAAILHVLSRHDSERMKPLSIFPPIVEAKDPGRPQPEGRRSFPREHSRVYVT